LNVADRGGGGGGGARSVISAAGELASPRVAGLPSLIGFTVVLVSLLTLVFPTGSEYAELTTVTKPDAYSVAYLEVLTRANPQEQELRLVYARQLGMLGRYDDAIQAIAPVQNTRPVGLAAKSLRLDLQLARARSISENDPARRDLAFVEVLRLLHEQADLQQTPQRNEALASLALELNDPKLAAQLYLKLAAQRPTEGARFHALAARWLRAGGDNLQAANSYQTACSLAKDPAEARDHALSAIQSIEADNKPVVAADLAAKYANEMPKDATILAEATRLATACGRLEAARTFGRKHLALVPNDDVAMRAQVTRELGMADPKAAMILLNKLVAHHPDDYDLRVLRVRTAEWAGDLDTAERDLIWLVAHTRKKV
jgi:polysaccharide biosynthesis protein PelB